MASFWTALPMCWKGEAIAVASTTEATALASPFQHIGKAVQNDATVIYLKAGTHNAVGAASTSRRTTNEWYKVQPAPGESASTVTVALDTTKTYKCQRLQFDSVKVTTSAAAVFLDGEAAGNCIRFTNCNLSSGGAVSSANALADRSDVCYVENCTGDLGATNWAMTSFSTHRVAMQLDGVVLGAFSTTSSCCYRVAACSSPAGVNVRFIERSSGNIAPLMDNFFFEFNKFYSVGTTGAQSLNLGVTNGFSRGISVSGNVLEKITGTAGILSIASDNTVAQCDHALIDHNTCAGERTNLSYNETGTEPFGRRFWGVRYNAFSKNIGSGAGALNFKSDPFGTASGNRVGGWPNLYGMNWIGNAETDTQGFNPAFPGLASASTMDFAGETHNNAAVCAMNFASDQSQTTSGSGGGDYTPATGSALKSLVPAGRGVLLWDLAGNAISTSGTGCAGAIQDHNAAPTLALSILSGPYAGSYNNNDTVRLSGPVTNLSLRITNPGDSDLVMGTTLFSGGVTDAGISGTVDGGTINPSGGAVTNLDGRIDVASNGDVKPQSNDPTHPIFTLHFALPEPVATLRAERADRADRATRA